MPKFDLPFWLPLVSFDDGTPGPEAVPDAEARTFGGRMGLGNIDWVPISPSPTTRYDPLLEILWTLTNIKAGPREADSDNEDEEDVDMPIALTFAVPNSQHHVPPEGALVIPDPIKEVFTLPLWFLPESGHSCGILRNPVE